jgi:antirestriction protein
MANKLNEAQKRLVEENDWNEEAVIAYVGLGIGDDDLSNFEEAYQGEWSCDEVFVQELLEDTGDLPKDLPPYLHIDWESTARDIMMDYSEQDGYYFRNL